MNDVSRLRSIRERNRIRDALPSVKVVFEVLAYVFGAIFLLSARCLDAATVSSRSKAAL